MKISIILQSVKKRILSAKRISPKNKSAILLGDGHVMLFFDRSAKNSILQECCDIECNCLFSRKHRMAEIVDVFVTNFTVHESKPVLFGVDDQGLTVGIRVIRFSYVMYIEPPVGADNESLSRKWFGERLRVYLDSSNNLSKYVRPSSQLVARRKLCGSSSSSSSGGTDKPQWWVKCSFDTVADMRRSAAELSRKFKCRIYHERLDPNLLFTAQTGIKPFTWVSCVRPTLVESSKITRCDRELLIDVKRVQPKFAEEDDPLNIPPSLKVATFDIETDGLDWATDELRMISVNCGIKNFLLTRHSLDMTEPPDYLVVDCDDEKDLIKKFVDLIAELRPVFLTGWNIFRFDVRFVFERAKTLGVFTDIERLSWLSSKRVQPVEKEMTSNAFGQNKVYHDDLEGLITLDGYILARKSMKMASYSLKAFGEWIGDQKGDVTYAQMLEAFRTRDPVKLREVADYCVQDSRLVPKILARMEEPDKVMAMARLAGVPPVYAIKRGQSILTFGLILGEAFARELVVNPPAKRADQEEGYKGATVVDPIRGYHKDPVAVLDFESLYPSIMRAYNICVSTYVGTFQEKPAAYMWPAYSVVELEGGEHVVFRKEGDEGVFPSILRVLLSRRKAVKGLMKTMAAGSVTYNQANAQQLSLKIAANSMYGYLGASTSQIYLKELAASVTSMGRQSLWKVRSLITEMRDAGRLPGNVHVVYGDSVSGTTPLVLRIKGQVVVRMVQELNGRWKGYGEDKEAFHPPCNEGWEVWGDEGFTPVLRVIRHRVTKPMMRVVTRRGLVDCTLDHSLLLADRRKISPANVHVGSPLLHSSSCRQQMVSILEKTASTMTPEAAFEMGAWGKVCDELLGAPKASVEAFWEGFDPEQGFFTKKVAAYLCVLGMRLGLTYRLECYDEASDLVALVLDADDGDGGEECVVGRWLLSGGGGQMVYDLETANHHFGVGPGTLVVHNTDSVMVKFPGSSPLEADAMARVIEKECTNAFVKPMRLEYESLFVTYLLENKKRYAGKVWNPTPGAAPEIMVKGLCVKRRDFPKVVQRGLSGILDILLEGGDDAPERALAFVREVLVEILRNQVDPAELCITKELNKSSYKTPPPHLIVSQKMAARNPEDPPKAGDRITFVVLAGKGNVSERVEAFDHVVATMGASAKYDLMYYADQLASQCENMMKLCGMGRAFQEALTAVKLRSQGQSRLTSYFKAMAGTEAGTGGSGSGTSGPAGPVKRPSRSADAGSISPSSSSAASGSNDEERKDTNKNKKKFGNLLRYLS